MGNNKGVDNCFTPIPLDTKLRTDPGVRITLYILSQDTVSFSIPFFFLTWLTCNADVTQSIITTSAPSSSSSSNPMRRRRRRSGINGMHSHFLLIARGASVVCPGLPERHPPARKNNQPSHSHLIARSGPLRSTEATATTFPKATLLPAHRERLPRVCIVRIGASRPPRTSRGRFRNGN